MKPIRHICSFFIPAVDDLAETWSPATNLYCKQGTWILEIELPGVKPEDVRVSVIGHAIEIVGERRQLSHSVGQKMYLFEISSHRFERRIELPQAIDVEEIAVQSLEGILFVELREKINE